MEGQKVLLVEDSPNLLKLQKAVFESDGFDVITAKDGQEAIRELEVHKIDLIMTDILMPNMDGYLLCYNIRTDDRHKNIPIIVYTATYTSKSDEALAIEIGADIFIRKPAGQQILLAAAKKLISRHAKSVRRISPGSFNMIQKYNARLLQKLEQKTFRLEDAKKQIANEEQRFRRLFESTPEGMTLLDLNTDKFIECNNNAVNLLKYTTEELMKRGPADISALVQPDGSSSEEKAKEFIGKALTGDNPVFEWLICDGNGKEIMTEVRLVALSDFDGPKILASFVDITERKEAEQMCENMTADLICRNKDLEQFAYIVSHNLRAPVANIVGILDLMSLMKPDIEKENEMKSALLTSVNRLDNVIKDLNDVLQAKDTMNEQKEIVSFSALLKDITQSMSNRICHEQVQIVNDFSAVDEMLTIKSYLYSIFLNLI